MRVAVVGAGISGLGAAYALSDQADVRLFEAAPRFGGHANTVDVSVDGTDIAVDTGFIVYNTRNYPNLTSLFAHLGVKTEWSDMSFGVSIDGGRMEYGCDDLDTVFAQRRNLLRPRFLRGVWEIVRFQKIAPKQMDAGALRDLSLGEWIAQEGFSDWFKHCFILPMGGAIWSTPPAEMMAFPAESFVAFYRNHDLMTGLDPCQRWRTVTGGSRAYVSEIVARLGSRAVAGARAVGLSRAAGLPELRFADGSRAVFDQVILACHAPEARALLSDADAEEEALLGTFRTTPNRAILHSDATFMPKRRKVWSSWNFLTRSDDPGEAPVPVTYWMNRLQTIDPARPLFVSLNPDRAPDPALTHAQFDYAHPAFDRAAFAAQRAMPSIQGRGGVWYAGAWLGYGFHEDGLAAGLSVAGALGAAPSWAAAMPSAMRSAIAKAAE